MKSDIEARCACGALSVKLARVSRERHLCCCTDCQRRTGAPFGVSWYYPLSDVLQIEGCYDTFQRTGTMGTVYDFHFCPSCGSTVFWHVVGEDEIGVAAGCIAPEHQVPPQDVVWVETRVQWVVLPNDIVWYRQGTTSEIVHRPI